ncbi:MAG: hypothetical protein ACR2QR_10880 [Woeseiaceae bacterium]
MSSNQPPAGSNAAVDRWTLSRDIAVLQVKLIVDGLRDFILVPISIVVGLYSLTQTGKPGDNEFYNLLRVGRKSERWINLFGAADRAREPDIERVNFPDDDIDSLVSKFEDFVVDEYKSGGVTKQAKEHLDQMLGSINKRRKRRSSESPPQ